MLKYFAVVVIAAVVVLGGVLVWHEANAPKIPNYLLELNIQPNSADIGNLTISDGSSYNYNITGSYFNVSLKGFTNWTLTFSYNVVYGNVYNTTAHIYLQSNLSVSFKTSLGSATPGGIYIS